MTLVADPFMQRGAKQIMNLVFGRCALIISAEAALLAACGESQLPIGASHLLALKTLAVALTIPGVGVLPQIRAATHAADTSR